jgi:hypothetical protein
MKDLKMNSSYTYNPSFSDLALGYVRVIKWGYSPEMMNGYSFPMSFLADFRHIFYFRFEEMLPIFIWSILFTALRYVFEAILCKVNI